MGEIKENGYICKICSKICVSGKSLGGHMRIHLALISASKKAAKDQSSEEKIDDADVDQNVNYQLRENPKKSWRVSSDAKHGLTKKWSSCGECGKGFPSLKALSGHMRSHSVKNKEMHYCEKCGRGFDSIRAVFGHMKSHSKKSRMRNNESADSLSDLESLCPVRRKRSRIGYRTALDETEEAATCLIMLSRGVTDFVKCETESSVEDFVYFGAQSSYGSKKFDDLDRQKNVGANEVSDDEMLSVDFDRVLKTEKCCEFDDLGAFDSLKLGEFESNYGKKAICCGNEGNVESTSEGGTSLESSKSKEYECLVCFKVFPSGQALGGHKRAHFNGLIESKKKESMPMIIMNQEVGERMNGHTALDLNFPAAIEEGSKNDVGFHPWGAEALVFSN